MKRTTLKLVSFFAFVVAALNIGCTAETGREESVSVDQIEPGAPHLGIVQPEMVPVEGGGKEAIPSLIRNVAVARGASAMKGIEPPPPDPCSDLVPSR